MRTNFSRADGISSAVTARPTLVRPVFATARSYAHAQGLCFVDGRVQVWVIAGWQRTGQRLTASCFVSSQGSLPKPDQPAALVGQRWLPVPGAGMQRRAAFREAGPKGTRHTVPGADACVRPDPASAISQPLTGQPPRIRGRAYTRYAGTAVKLG